MAGKWAGSWLGKWAGKWFGSGEESGYVDLSATLSGAGLVSADLSSEGQAKQDDSGGLLKVHRERLAKVQQARLRRYQRILEEQKRQEELAEEAANLVIVEIPKPDYSELVALATPNQKPEEAPFEISPELVAKLASIRQVAIEQVAIPEIAPDHLAMIRNNDDALAMILIYWAAEEDA